MSKISISVREARDLVAADKQGTSDPYVTIEYFDSIKNKTYKEKSKVIKKTLNPVWNETFDFANPVDSNRVSVLIYDYDAFGKSDCLGKLHFTIADFKSLVLQGKSSEWFNLTEISRGSLHLGFFFDPPLSVVAPPTAMNPSVVGPTPIVSNYNNAPINPQIVHQVVVEKGEKGYVPTLPDTESNIYVGVAGQSPVSQIFVTGNKVAATLYFNVAELFTDVRTIWVTFRGETQVNGRKEKKVFSTYFNLIPEGKKIRLERGKHSFPFSFPLPKHLPTSFRGNGYAIVYSMTIEADVVNREDEISTKEIKVVNLEHTPYGRVPRSVTQSITKKGMVGKPVAMTASIQKDYFLPLEDVEISVGVDNQNTKKIKKLEVTLHQRSKFGSSDTTSVVAAKSLRFFSPIYPNSSGQNTFIFEMPRNLQHSFDTNGISFGYFLKVKLDVPNAPDLEVNLPVSVVLPDPQIHPVLNPLDEVARLPLIPSEWTAQNVATWLQHKANLPQFVPAFQSLDITGKEMISLVSSINPVGFEGIKYLSAADPAHANSLHNSIFELIAKRERVAIFLKSLDLAKYISEFEAQEITWDILPQLSELNLNFLPVGPQKKVWLAIQNGLK